jgi:hypothetical protein
MNRQPRNRIWSPYHDPVHDFRVIAEFTQRFPHLQLLWFARHTAESTGLAECGPCTETMHIIKFRTDRAGLRSVCIPRPKPGQTSATDYIYGVSPITWSWRIDARCKLPYAVKFWCERLPESHPMAWLAPARLESTPFAGDLDSLVWGDALEQAA